MAESDYDTLYSEGLKYRDLSSPNYNLDLAIEYLKKASGSRKQWILNDYALSLIQRGSSEDLDESVSILSDLCLVKNNQSLRLMGLALIKKDHNFSVIGECLLNYSADLGNKWALLDLLRIKEDRNTAADRQFIRSYYGTEQMSEPGIANIVFKVLTGYKGGSPDLEKIDILFERSYDNEELHLSFLRIIGKTKNPLFASIVLNSDDLNKPLYAVEIAKMYRDGGVLKQSNAMFDKIVNGLPESYKVSLEDI